MELRLSTTCTACGEPVAVEVPRWIIAAMEGAQHVSAHHPMPIAPAPAPPSSGGGAGQKKGAVPSLEARKDAINAQLPLRPGRPIAVKESKKNVPPAPGNAPDNFILGRIVMCLQGDKNRLVGDRYPVARVCTDA